MSNRDSRTSAADAEEHGKFGRGARWLFWRHLAFGGLAGALVFFCLSLTPSLLPRPWFLQGAVSGITAAIGYGLGSLISTTIRKLLPSEPSSGTKRIAWRVLVMAAVLLVALFLYLGNEWQKVVRELQGLDPLTPNEWLGILLVTAVVFYLVLIIARAVRGATIGLIWLASRVLSPGWAGFAGVVASVFIFGFLMFGWLLDGVYDVIDAATAARAAGTSEGVVAPTSSLRSGSPTSLVTWESLGSKGRDFVGTGPTTDEITAVTGQTASEPIRIYVGLKSADSLEERIDLAMQELDRTGAFDRPVILVHTPSGNGEIIREAAESLEYMYGGATAQVAIQYSYLPSWVTMFAKPDDAVDHTRGLVVALNARLAQIPQADRPKLLLYGESLGSYGTEEAFEGVQDMAQRMDGALLVGPPFLNPMRDTVIQGRDPASPVWLAVYQDGQTVRFAVTPSNLAEPGPDWPLPRIVYFQNSTDAVSWWVPELLFAPPEWLDDPRGPDVSPDMTWIPVITFWQTLVDLMMGSSAEPGHGHRYGVNVVDGMVAIADPPNWSPELTAQLRDLLREEE